MAVQKRPDESGNPGTGGPEEKETDREIRLQVYLARSGVSSRRSAEELIAAGRIRVNGRVVTRPGTKVGPDAEVTLDGRRVRPVREMIYLALNKPPGYITSERDPEGRPLASDLLRPAIDKRVFHVGRLDFLSSGLILFTNDGEFARRLSHPSAGVEKEYRVETTDPFADDLLREWQRGIEIEGERYRLARFERKGPRAVDLVLIEGKNREIRRVFHSRNIPVRRVHRIRIGSVTLGGLASGRFRHLTEKEIRRLRSGSGGE